METTNEATDNTTTARRVLTKAAGIVDTDYGKLQSLRV
jgi:hypothetical protein